MPKTLHQRNEFNSQPARRLVASMLEAPQANHYTIRKAGRRTIIHQLPRYEGGQFAGLVEISLAIPDELPEFDSDAAAPARR